MTSGSTAAVYNCNTDLASGLNQLQSSTALPTTGAVSSFRPQFNGLSEGCLPLASLLTIPVRKLVLKELAQQLAFLVSKAIKNVTTKILGRTATVTNTSGNNWTASNIITNDDAAGDTVTFHSKSVTNW